MNTRRSYLDSLNAGRPRKAHASLEELNRSLANLENRLGRQADPVRERDAAYRSPEPPRPARRPDTGYQDIAREIDRVRGQEEGVASVGRIASELKGLRDELRHQMTSGLRREFDTLRKGIENAYASAPTAKDGAALAAELERLSGSIQSLSQRSDDRGVNMLRLEIEQVKGALDSLAREETVRSVDRRWDDFDKRWARFEDRYSADRATHADDPALAALNQRLEQINEAVGNLPESLSLRSLEEKVRILASAVDHFASQQDQRGHETFALIEERVDEISRAIVASTASLAEPHFDPQPFERIEARISSLAHQIEELIEDRPSAEVIDRLNALSQRVEDIAARGMAPEQAMERLARQIAEIADKIDGAPRGLDAEPIIRGIESRFEMLSEMIERRQGDAIEHGQLLFRDLEKRIDDVAGRLNATPQPDTAQILQDIETRFATLSDMVDRRQEDAIEHGQSLFRDLEQRLDGVAARLDQRQSVAGLDESGIMDAIDARFNELARKIDSGRPGADAEAMREMEARLENISTRLESSAAHVAAIDPDLIRNLESQVSELSAHLSRPSAPLPEHEDIAPRLMEIEKSIAGSRDTILEAARQAAEDAVRAFAGSSSDSAAVAGLAEDLKSLEALTRRSDERNTKTFEAIHDTLLKIVDRLGTLEDGDEGMTAASTKLAIAETPSLDAHETAPLDSDDAPESAGRANAGMTPAQAAAAAALAAMDNEHPDPGEEPSGRVRSMLGGLTRAFSRKERTEPTLAGSETPAVAMEEAPTLELDEPLDPKLANRPLEPGSGGPDLNAIMKRVRDERGQTAARADDAETARSDFIAAARRAAQAAAAEAGTLKRQVEIGDTRKSLGIGEFLRGKRKPMLMGAVAVMLALAGMQLGKAFLADDEAVAGNDATPPVVVQQAPEAAPEAAAPVSADANAGEPARVVGMDTAGANDPTEAIASDATDMTADAGDVADGEPMDTIDETPEATARDDDQNMPTAAVEPQTATATAALAPTPAPVADPAPVEAGPVPLREAADAGDPKALFEIGSRYADGRGVKSDMKAAAKWYQKSAELGFAPAQYRIGNFFEKGIGVDRDIAKAKTWYQLAAEQGNASAMHNLAVLYAMGADGVTDNESAARWFEKAAEFGVKDSQFNLGILAAKGVGMKQSLEESYKWFALVAKAGDKDAAAKRDEVANALRPDQLQRARAAAELWKPKPVDAQANTVDIPEAWRESNAKTAGIDMKKAVTTIQAILNKNGYDAGAPDGLMGDKTRAAIVEFQKDNDLDPNGEVDDRLVQALLEKK
jgi:localization factor PodJL